jgi:hypothetical protein
MPRVGLEPAIPATKRPQTYALDRAATGIDTTSQIQIRLLTTWHQQRAFHVGRTQYTTGEHHYRKK